MSSPATTPNVHILNHESFFAHVRDFFVSVDTKVHKTFNTVFGTATGEVVLQKLEAAVHSGLKSIVDTAVQDAVSLVVSGTEKRLTVFNNVKSAAASAGIQAESNIVNILIEGAVARLNPAPAPASVPVPTP